MAQDVLEGNNVNTALAKRSEEAIGGLVPQAGSGRKSTVVYPRSRPRRLSTLVVNLSGTPWHRLGSSQQERACELQVPGISDEDGSPRTMIN